MKKWAASEVRLRGRGITHDRDSNQQAGDLPGERWSAHVGYKQFRWIVTIQGGLDAIFRNEVDVFVAGNLLWYPVEGNNKIRTAPDIFVVFGRPEGDRGAYLQWLEGNIAPQVLFEIVSPGNRAGTLTAKFSFYERYGGEEYYLYDPDTGDLRGWIRSGGRLEEIPQMNGWTSPRLKVRFEILDGELCLFGPDGKRF